MVPAPSERGITLLDICKVELGDECLDLSSWVVARDEKIWTAFHAVELMAEVGLEAWLWVSTSAAANLPSAVRGDQVHNL
jgi:hypothetical protein